MATHLPEVIELRWQQLLAVDQVLEEIAAEFEGEDPARPQERRAVAEGREKLRELHEVAQDCVGHFDLPGIDEDEIAQLREAIWRVADD